MDNKEILNMLKQAHLCLGAVEVRGAANVANMYNGFALLERVIKDVEKAEKERGKEVTANG